MLPEDFLKPLPRHPVPTGAATQPFAPNASDSPVELRNTAVVRRSSVVLLSCCVCFDAQQSPG
jgi:hypothetical protein